MVISGMIWIRKYLILFVISFILSFLFPLTSDDLMVNELVNEKGYIEGALWLWKVCNPRIQNLGVFAIPIGIHNILVAVIMVWFVKLASDITNKSPIVVCSFFLLSSFPSMWVDGWLWVSGCMNYLLGMCIILQATQSKNKYWSLISGMSGELFGPIICLYWLIKKEYKLCLFSTIGFILFLIAPGNWSRADSVNDWIDLTKMVELWKPFSLMFIWIIFTDFKASIWTILSITMLALIWISPYPSAGLNRVMLMPLILLGIDVLMNVKTFRYVKYSIIVFLVWVSALFSQPTEGYYHKIFFGRELYDRCLDDFKIYEQ